MGIQGVVVAVVALAYTVSAFGEGAMFGGGLLATLTLLAFTGGFGVLRRKRYGVVSFVVTWASLILLPLLVSSKDDLPNPSQVIAPLIGLGINIWYFARRWKFMGSDFSEVDGEPAESGPEAPE